MGTSSDRLWVDDLTFEIRRSPRRKTIELIVDRDGTLIVVAPDGVEESVLYEFVHEKRFWLYTKIAEKQARRWDVPQKEFVNGEGFPYLGRTYRLKLVDDQNAPLKLVSGRFCLRRSLAASGRKQFIAWYASHAMKWLTKRLNEWAIVMGVTVTDVMVQDLGFRWGSCSATGVVNFHWATILLPPSIVDYVIVHELAHLVEPNHTAAFWTVVESAMFDYEDRKDWLATHGAGFNL